MLSSPEESEYRDRQPETLPCEQVWALIDLLVRLKEEGQARAALCATPAWEPQSIHSMRSRYSRRRMANQPFGRCDDRSPRRRTQGTASGPIERTIQGPAHRPDLPPRRMSFALLTCAARKEEAAPVRMHACDQSMVRLFDRGLAGAGFEAEHAICVLRAHRAGRRRAVVVLRSRTGVVAADRVCQSGQRRSR